MWRDVRCVLNDTRRLFASTANCACQPGGNLGGHGTQYMHGSVVSTPCDDELAACADEDDAASASSSSPASNSRHRTLSIAPATLAAKTAYAKLVASSKVIRVCLPPSTRPSTAPRRQHLDQTSRMCFDVAMWGAVGTGLAKLVCVWANVPTQHTTTAMLTCANTSCIYTRSPNCGSQWFQLSNHWLQLFDGESCGSSVRSRSIPSSKFQELWQRS
jgi:hypothetical protein